MDSGGVVDTPVSLADLMPTIHDVAGIDVPDGVQGVPVNGAMGEYEMVVISDDYPYKELIDINPSFDRTSTALISPTHKYIASTNGKLDLYDLSKDPGETSNLYTWRDPVASKLDSSLKDWLASTPTASPSSEKLSAGAVERLKALGYVQ